MHTPPDGVTGREHVVPHQPEREHRPRVSEDFADKGFPHRAQSEIVRHYS